MNWTLEPGPLPTTVAGMAVSAPTALAIKTADEAGITLLAIARDDGYGVFTHPRRVLLPDEAATHAGC